LRARPAASRSVTRLAPAKINLALHVTGRRDDGYHLLDMLVAFARFGDTITVADAPEDQFTVNGPFAVSVPLDGGNLVLKARDALRAHAGGNLPPVAIHLEKNLPIASGIGGGSSDAAATLLALDTLWGLNCDFDTLAALGLALGADLPMCLHGAAHGTPLTARGIGEDLAPVTGHPRRVPRSRQAGQSCLVATRPKRTRRALPLSWHHPQRSSVASTWPCAADR
jgi:4-diphosphocytidyl-2-C-methyl-D-erythritol kinase